MKNSHEKVTICILDEHNNQDTIYRRNFFQEELFIPSAKFKRYRLVGHEVSRVNTLNNW